MIVPIIALIIVFAVAGYLLYSLRKSFKDEEKKTRAILENLWTKQKQNLFIDIREANDKGLFTIYER